jgi:hypothetical protein
MDAMDFRIRIENRAGRARLPTVDLDLDWTAGQVCDQQLRPVSAMQSERCDARPVRHRHRAHPRRPAQSLENEVRRMPLAARGIVFRHDAGCAAERHQRERLDACGRELRDIAEHPCRAKQPATAGIVPRQRDPMQAVGVRLPSERTLARGDRARPDSEPCTGICRAQRLDHRRQGLQRQHHRRVVGAVHDR